MLQRLVGIVSAISATAELLELHLAVMGVGLLGPAWTVSYSIVSQACHCLVRLPSLFEKDRVFSMSKVPIIARDQIGCAAACFWHLASAELPMDPVSLCTRCSGHEAGTQWVS